MTAPAAPVTIILSREVLPGREHDFHRWAEKMSATASEFPGHLGDGMLRVTADAPTWDLVYRFASAEQLAAWDDSPEKARLQDEGAACMRQTRVRRLDGLDAWFDAGPQTPRRIPPKWKTYLMTACVLLVLQNLVALALSPLVGHWPTVLRSGAIILVVVALMTWLAMPWVSRLLSGWLYGTSRPSQEAKAHPRSTGGV